MNIRTLAVCAALAASSLAVAQPITDSFTYQGTLNDGGAPANGLYDITFQIHQAEIGGTASFSKTVANIEVTDGLFEAYINFALSGVVFDTDQTRWLELRVTEAGQPGVTILAPRQRIVPAPLANYALRAGQAGFATTSGTTLQDAYNNGGVIVVNSTQGNMELQSSFNYEAKLVIRNDSGNPLAIIGQEASGAGELKLNGPVGVPTHRMEYDNSIDGGGFFLLGRNDSGNAGIILDGNRFDSEASFLSVAGPQRTIILDSSVSGNSSVVLPIESIVSQEIQNEAGVAENSTNSTVSLTANSLVMDNIASVTVNAPSNGYVLVIASLELSANHVAGSTTSVNIGVSTSPTSLPTNGDVETRLGSTLPTGGYDHAVTVHSVFSATAGSNTYYLNGDLNTGSSTATALDTQLSAIFIPTAYGSTSIQAETPNIPDEFIPVRGPQTQYDIVMEQNAALKANMTRQQHELDAMKAQMQQLLRETQNDPQLNQRDK